MFGQGKRAISIVEKDGDLVRSGVCNGQIRCAVAIQIRDEDFKSAATDGISDGRIEGSVAFAQQDIEIRRSFNSWADDQVGLAVKVQITSPY